MLDRLLLGGVSLFGFCGVASLLFVFAVLPEQIEGYEDLARMSRQVQVRLLSIGVRKVAAGRPSNKPRYNYTPVGTFEIVGQEGVSYENVDLDNGTLRVEETEALQAAAQYRTGMVLDAWFDPRSRHDALFFPLVVKNPAVAAEQQRQQRSLFTWMGGGSLAISSMFVLLMLRR